MQGLSASPRRGWPLWGALLWLVAVAIIAGHQWVFWRAPALNTDVFDLLPQDQQQPLAQQAMTQMAGQAERRIVVMLGAADWETAQAAAKRFDASLTSQHAGLHRTAEAGGDALDFYKPWRDALLTDAQRRALVHPDVDALAGQALARLHGLSAGQPTTWLADPLGLWAGWWSQRASVTAARPRDGLLWAPDPKGDREWAVLLYEVEGSAFRMDGERRWADALERAGQPLKNVQVISAGIPLHAEAGAAQGSWEMNVIGWGSLAAVIALVWGAFKALRPVVLIAGSLLIGCAAGLSVTVWVFGEVHVLTLVFGASLVGVAEDFGIHYFASRLGAPTQSRWTLMRHLWPGLALALATSVLSYLVMGVVPFPGLRQMAVFSAVGLTAAFLTVVCWFAWLDTGKLPGGRLEHRIAGSLQRWPRWRVRWTWAVGVLAVLWCAWGLSRLSINDDVRQLQSSPPALMKAQIQVGQLLKVPSPAQFFLVRGKDAEEVLQREEALKQALTPWIASQLKGGADVGLAAVSDWVPSAARQATDRALTATAEQAVLARVAHALDEPLVRPAFSPQPLTVPAWLASDASMGARGQWIDQPEGGGKASAVLIRGLAHAEQLAELQRLAGTVPGVSWVDRVDAISQLMGRFRHNMGWLLVVGHVLVWAALAVRFGQNAWRAWLPTAIASVLCVATLGVLHEPFQLFSLLALLLLLGMGVDYGIFLMEHQGDEQGHAWLAVVLGACSTALSFGLLGLSTTPALHSFGLTLLIGLTIVCLLAPCLRLETTPSEGSS
ncbi:MAG TPA: hypothetical protein H9903_19940 [Candidatus Aquabacterium excrementipullorum]|nr:hypothetical protein [Candidatus Aquabacterium excrementipullorum]